MLKLLKHDLKNSSKSGFIILSLGLIANILVYYLGPKVTDTVNENFYFNISGSTLSSILLGFSILVIFGAVIGLFYLIISTFRKDYYSDRAYLMATLPVTSKDILNSKILFGLIWTLIFMVSFFLVNLISVFIVFDMSNFVYAFRTLTQAFDMKFISLVFWTLDWIISTLTVLLIAYFSVVATKALFKESKTGYWWILIFILVSDTIAFISNKIFLAIPKGFSFVGDGIVDYNSAFLNFSKIEPNTGAEFFKDVNTFLNQIFNSIPIIPMTINILAIVVIYFVTIKIMDKKIDI
ncbi:MAG: hypothetical protein SPI59_03970 [Finegoldia sp.]|nr:hypothetical protein [Finegoldia sp.]